MEQLTLLPEGSHASPLVSPDEKRERKMTVTSGRKCLELYKNSSPLGSLAKTLLTSSIWHSNARKLTWKVKATKCNHLLFQLAVSVRPIDEIECGLWPTPRASKAMSEPTLNIQKRGSYRGRLEEKVAMHPTPRASDSQGGKCQIIPGTNQRISKSGIKPGWEVEQYLRQWQSEPNVGRVANGVPNRVDRLKSLGNAIVPQVAYHILKAINDIEK